MLNFSKQHYTKILTSILICFVGVVATHNTYALEVTIDSKTKQSRVTSTSIDSLNNKLRTFSSGVESNTKFLTKIQSKLATLQQDINVTTPRKNASVSCHNQGKLYNKTTKTCVAPLADANSIFKKLGCTNNQVIAINAQNQPVCKNIGSTSCNCPSKSLYYSRVAYVYNVAVTYYYRLTPPASTTCFQNYYLKGSVYISTSKAGPYNLSVGQPMDATAICTVNGWQYIESYYDDKKTYTYTYQY